MINITLYILFKIINILKFLNIYSKSRKHWTILIFSIFLLEGTALLLQHFLLLKPCVLCIYQRCALCGIAISGTIAVIFPSYTPLRILSISTWIYSSWKGLIFAKKQNNMQLYPSPFFKCELFVQFPDWLPLNTWWPTMFQAYGDCASYIWSFLSLEISQWMFIIFINYLILGILILLSQFVRIKNN